jgi:hypothetical protein
MAHLQVGFAGVLSLTPCKWCGEIPIFVGLFVNATKDEIVLACACQKHDAHLISFIDGLTNGSLAKHYEVQAEELN